MILLTIPNRVAGGDFDDTLPSVNSTTLNVTWLPPVTPNGLIEYYNIDVTNKKADQPRFPFYNFQVPSVEGQTQYTRLVANLSEWMFLLLVYNQYLNYHTKTTLISSLSQNKVYLITLLLEQSMKWVKG